MSDKQAAEQMTILLPIHYSCWVVTADLLIMAQPSLYHCDGVVPLRDASE